MAANGTWRLLGESPTSDPEGTARALPIMLAGDRHALLDRAVECRVLGRLLDDVRAGSSSALVISGEAGVGKTALLDYLAQEAAGFRLARIAGVESETDMAFAALQRLCAPMLGGMDALPAVQQTALRVAFALSSGDPPDGRVVESAVLSLLGAVAMEQPPLCLVDDAQWLDAASGDVLGFVARRLLTRSVAIVFVVRDKPDEGAFVGLPEVVIGRPGFADARALLATAVAVPLDPGIRDRLIAHETLRAAVEGGHVVVHLAEVFRTEDEDAIWRANLDGTRNLVAAV
jgi:AAA ATPase domain